MARAISVSSSACLVVLGLLFTGPALADDGPSQIDRDAARTLVQQGDERVEQGDFRAALEAYRRADDIMGVPTTAIEVGKMHEKLGELVSALEAYERAAAFPEKDGEPEPFTVARDSAKERKRELEPRIPKLELDIDGVATDIDIEVTIDEQIVEAWGRPFRIDPGPHEMVVRAEGYEDYAETFVLDEGSERTIDVSMTAVEKDLRTVPDDEGGDLWPLAIAGFSVAGVGLVAGAVTGALHLSDASTLKDNCTDGVCPPTEQGTLDRSRVLAHTSTASFALAGVGAVLGTIGLVLSLDGGEDDGADDTALTLQLGPSVIGLSGRF